jgi:hypothetical protein
MARIRELGLFPTAVIGSLPRPPWLLDRLHDYIAGNVSRADWDRACDQAVPFAVALQETAGIDIITDGEWRREGYFQVVYERVEGFAPDLIAGRTRRWPAVVAPLRRREPIIAGGIAFLRKHTTRAIKATLPSAYVILRRPCLDRHRIDANRGALSRHQAALCYTIHPCPAPLLLHPRAQLAAHFVKPPGAELGRIGGHFRGRPSSARCEACRAVGSFRRALGASALGRAGSCLANDATGEPTPERPTTIRHPGSSERHGPSRH